MQRKIDIDYQALRMDEWELIRDKVVLFLTDKAWLGYGTLPFTKSILKNVLKPRVNKITHYIYTRGICHVTFFSQITGSELWEIV